MIQRCEIPIPPSANELHMPLKTKKGRVFMAKTTKYKNWLEVAGMMLKVGLDKVVTLPVAITVEVRGGFDFPKSRDIDNVGKACVDALRLAKIIPNDRVTEVTETTQRYLPVQDERLPATCTVIVEQLEAGLFS